MEDELSAEYEKLTELRATRQQLGRTSTATVSSPLTSYWWRLAPTPFGEYTIIGEADGTLHAFVANSTQGFAAAPLAIQHAVSDIDVGTDASPAFGDLTGDGLDDAVIGCAEGSVRIFTNVGTTTNPQFGEVADGVRQGVDLLGQESYGIQTVPALGDISGDGVPDLVVGSGDGTLRCYINNGFRIYEPGTQAHGAFSLLTSPNDPMAGISVASRSAPFLVDLDQDGLLDLLMGSAEGDVRMHINQGTRNQASFAPDGVMLQATVYGPSVPTIIQQPEGTAVDSLLLAIGGGDGTVHNYNLGRSGHLDQQTDELYGARLRQTERPGIVLRLTLPQAIDTFDSGEFTQQVQDYVRLSVPGTDALQVRVIGVSTSSDGGGRRRRLDNVGTDVTILIWQPSSITDEAVTTQADINSQLAFAFEFSCELKQPSNRSLFDSNSLLSTYEVSEGLRQVLGNGNERLIPCRRPPLPPSTPPPPPSPPSPPPATPPPAAVLIITSLSSAGGGDATLLLILLPLIFAPFLICGCCLGLALCRRRRRRSEQGQESCCHCSRTKSPVNNLAGAHIIVVSVAHY